MFISGREIDIELRSVLHRISSPYDLRIKNKGRNGKKPMFTNDKRILEFHCSIDVPERLPTYVGLSVWEKLEACATRKSAIV